MASVQWRVNPFLCCGVVVLCYCCGVLWLCCCFVLWLLWCGHGVDDVSLTISHHKRAPNSGDRTPRGQTPGVPATWASTSGWTEAEKWRHDRHKPPPHRHSEDLVDELKLRINSPSFQRDTDPNSTCRCTPTGVATTLSKNTCGFSQRSATVGALSPPRQHLRNLHDQHNRDIDLHLWNVHDQHNRDIDHLSEVLQL